MEFKFNDGGRLEAGYKVLHVGDCITRATAIATKRDYKKIYKELTDLQGESARNGVYLSVAKQYLISKGWKYVPAKSKLRFRADNLPKRKQIIVDCKPSNRSPNRHYAAVIDGVLNDTYQCDKNGETLIYGYWVRK